MPLALATIEHLVNRRDGGTNRQMNMALACYRCNNKRNAREAAMERRYGLRKFVRRRLRLFRMDAGAQELIRVVVVGDRLKLKPVRLTGEGAQR